MTRAARSKLATRGAKARKLARRDPDEAILYDPHGEALALVSANYGAGGVGEDFDGAFDRREDLRLTVLKSEIGSRPMRDGVAIKIGAKFYRMGSSYRDDPASPEYDVPLYLDK